MKTGGKEISQPLTPWPVKFVVWLLPARVKLTTLCRHMGGHVPVRLPDVQKPGALGLILLPGARSELYQRNFWQDSTVWFVNITGFSGSKKRKENDSFVACCYKNNITVRKLSKEMKTEAGKYEASFLTFKIFAEIICSRRKWWCFSCPPTWFVLWERPEAKDFFGVDCSDHFSITRPRCSSSARARARLFLSRNHFGFRSRSQVGSTSLGHVNISTSLHTVVSVWQWACVTVKMSYFVF